VSLKELPEEGEISISDGITDLLRDESAVATVSEMRGIGMGS
jgi:hypothetical protein